MVRSAEAIVTTFAFLAVALGGARPACSSCVSADLGLCLDCVRPPVDQTIPGVSFPHTRTTVSDAEQYRVTAANPLVTALSPLYVVKGSAPADAVLRIDLECRRPPGFEDSFTPTRQLHVTTTGTASGDGSPANPFGMPSQAAAVAVPGDMIVLHEGRYSGDNYISNLQGTAGAPIVMSGAAGEGPAVLADAGEPLHLIDPLYVVLQDFTVEDATSNGINIDDGGDYTTPAQHVVIRGLTVRRVGSSGNNDCIKLSGVDDFRVLNSVIEECSPLGTSGSGIDMVGCHRGLIEGNRFRAMGGNAIQAKGASEAVVIQGNFMTDAGERALNLGGSTGAAYFRPLGADYEARNLQALSNVIVGSWSPIAFVGCDGCLVANNTLYQPEHWVARILQESVTGYVPCRNGRFINNLIVFNRAQIGVFVNVGPDTEPQSFVFSNNLWYCLDDPSFSGPSLPVAETNPVIQQDPLLADPAGWDFHIPAASPAAGAGICFNEIVRDYDGRCFQAPPSIGAFEQPW